jgi:thiosulfate dehydrogenase
VESLEDRINDCLVRSLNGQALDSLSKEMTAIVAYIRWLGKGIPRGTRAPGSGFLSMPFLDRAANPAQGKKLFMEQCRVCHGTSGEGLRLTTDGPFIYPPLCGEASFTTAAGLFRITNFAQYIRSNMPNGATFEKPILTHEQAWDIAAYVISLPRPEKIIANDWPLIETKPVDYPFGPYADGYSEEQHKYGPYPPILQSKKK